MTHRQALAGPAASLLAVQDQFPVWTHLPRGTFLWTNGFKIIARKG